ncbi:MAG: hypothetical protein ACXWUP_06505 [Allosphingosinicella sp.]
MKGPGLDPESLLRIPLAAQLFADPEVSVVVRGIDSRWAYSGIVGTRVDGFSPFHGVICVGHHSHLALWLPHRAASARPHNRRDRLVGELLFAIHDYLHIWSYRWIARLWPELGFGTAPITPANFEDMVFCHLLSEAAATVGLDYWYLACVRLHEVVPIGSTHLGLTVSYREDQEAEYRRFHPGLRVQCPEFFGSLARFYCDGAFPGFSIGDMESSPQIWRWLDHELGYGEVQRRYCREWFSYLSGDAVVIEESQLAVPVQGNRDRQDRVAQQIGELLWSKVKQDDPCHPGTGFDPDALWQPPAAPPRRYQFVNLNRDGLPDKEAAAALSASSFRYLLHQYIAGFDHAAFPDDAVPLLAQMYEERNLEVGRCLLKDMRRMPVSADEPLSLFLYN